jgi:hypothetical protein
MIEANMSHDQQVRSAARTLPEELITEIEDRARILGISVVIADDGATVEVTARLS